MVASEMIHAEYIADKLNYQAGRFAELMRNQEYPAAKACYDAVLTVVVFLDLPDSVKMEFFGNRPYAEDGDEIVDGLFKEELVQKAYRECAVKRNLGRENQVYRLPFAK